MITQPFLRPRMHGSSNFLFPFVTLKVIIAQGRVNVVGNFTYLVTAAQQLRITQPFRFGTGIQLGVSSEIPI